MKKLAIIGVGNMGGAIARRLLDKKIFKPGDICLSNKTPEDLEGFRKVGCLVTDDNIEAVREADMVLLAVKPQAFPTLLREYQISNISAKGGSASGRKYPISNKLFITIAAGVTIATIKKALGEKQPVVRVMPNLCASVGESMSVWVKSTEVTKVQTDLIKKILRVIGQESELSEENLIDAATAISGSGPAYYFYLTELLEENAVRLGIPDKTAKKLAKQTLAGSAKVLKYAGDSPRELRQKVTSKGGVTEAAFAEFEKKRVKDIFAAGIQANLRRAKELNK